MNRTPLKEPIKKKPVPYYTRRDDNIDWIRPVLWFGGIAILVALLVLGNLPG